MEKERPIYIDVTWYSDSRQEQAFFIPDETINCVPPHIKGKQDTIWITRNVNKYNKKECEEAVGMLLQPMNAWFKEQEIKRLKRIERIKNIDNSLTV
jgi:hypothetical protein